MKILFKSVVVLLLVICNSAMAQQQAAKPKYNVLFIMSDDLRAETGSYGGLAKTPNIDALAKSGLQFNNAYCQYPLCNPSRSSMLTGRHPTTTGILGNNTVLQVQHPEFISLPKWFKQNGYKSLRTGKIFHGGMDDFEAWDEGGERRGQGAEAAADFVNAIYALQQAPTPATQPASTARPNVISRGRGNDAGLTQAQRSDRIIIMPEEGNGNPENGGAERAIAYLNKYKDQPFFIGCGFSKPHSPPGAPQKYFDMYDVNKIPLPPDYAPRPTVWPGFPQGSIRPRNADLFIGRDSTPETVREMIQAYLASTSYMDNNVGKVLAELDRLGLADKTIVLFWGDHGYQLGEKGKWSKAGSVWENGARVPFIMRVPNAAANGKVTTRIVSMVDIYPTLVELCGLPNPGGLEGHSMVPLINDPQAKWDYPAFTSWCEDGRTLTAVSVRVPKWRFANFTLGGHMLLDEEADPHEMKNLAGDPQYAQIEAQLADLVSKYAANLGKTQQP